MGDRTEADVMSTAAGMDPDLEDQFETARDTMHTAEVGDDVIFGDRKIPLTVSETGGTPDDDRYLVLDGPQGGEYRIEENYYGQNGAPNYRTSDGSKSANDLRFAGDTEGPDWTSFVNEIRHSDADAGPDMGPEEPPASTSTSSTTPTDTGFARFEITDNQRTIVAEGFNFDYGVGFEAEFVAATNGMVLREFDLSGHLDGQDPFDLAEEVADRVEDKTGTIVAEPAPPGAFSQDVTEEGGAPPYNPKGAGTEDRGTDTRDPPLDTDFEYYRPPEVPEDAEVHDADDYVWELTSDLSADYEEFLEDTDVPESELDEGVIQSFFSNDEAPTWTFVDELLAFNNDVPKTVNNWHLIDYGVITDDFVDNARKMAWYNFETDELLVLAAINPGDGAEWLVYHSTHGPEPNDEPLVHTEDPDEAISVAKEQLYGPADSVDMSVEEGPDGRVTVRDAISNTNLAQKVMSAKGVDPFGMRAYVRSTSTGQFILDADEVLFDTLALARNKSSNYAERVRDFFSQHRMEIARQAKFAILKSLVGVSKRITGLDVSPVIDYQEIGITVEYKYTPDGDEDKNDPTRLTLSTRPVLRDVRLGVAYMGLVELYDFMEAERWTFPIPGPDLEIKERPKTITEDGEEVKISWPYISVGTKRAVTTSPTGTPSGPSPDIKTASTYEDLASGEAQKSRITPEAIDDSRLDELLREFEGQDKKQRYITQLATMSKVEDWFDEDVSDFGGPEDTTFRSKAGNPRAEFADVYTDYGIVKDDVLPFDLVYAVLDDVQSGGKTIAKALDDALDEADVGWSARSSDFDEYHIAGSGSVPDGVPEAGGGESGEELHPDHEPEESGGIEWGIFDADERERINKLLVDLEKGRVRPGELTPDEKNLLRRAEVESGMLERDEAEFLQQLDDQLEPPTTSPTEATEELEESGAVDEVAAMDDDEKVEAMLNIHKDNMEGPTQAPDNDEDEYDPDNPGDLY